MRVTIREPRIVVRRTQDVPIENIDGETIDVTVTTRDVAVTTSPDVTVTKLGRGFQGDPGLSAYEVALADGFVGTDDEWLASLVGPQGPPGETVVEVVQSSPATDWTVVHGLGRRPAAVKVYDTANTEIIGSFEYVDADTFVMHFSAPFAGRTEVF